MNSFYLLNIYSDIFILAGFFIFAIGASMGSFLNVVVDRVIHNESLLGRSHCDSCKKKLSWNDLIPVISYTLLRGRCRYCDGRFSVQYPIMEVATGVLYVLTWFYTLNHGGDWPRLLLYWGIVSSAWVIFISDLRYSLISDYMQLAFGIFLFIEKSTHIFTMQTLVGDIVSGVCVGLPLWLIYKLSKERAMGEGDGILAFLIGFGLGLPRGLLALYIAFVSGAVVGIFLLITRRKKVKSAVPFGPFILFGGAIVTVYGPALFAVMRTLYHW